MVLVAAADRRPFARATISSHLAKLHSLLFLAMQRMWNVTEFTKATTRKKSETSDVILLSHPPLPDIWHYFCLCDVSQALTGLLLSL